MVVQLWLSESEVMLYKPTVLSVIYLQINFRRGDTAGFSPHQNNVLLSTLLSVIKLMLPPSVLCVHTSVKLL